MESSPKPPTPEQHEMPHILGKITIMRHGDTTYGDQYPGISEKGIEQMRKNAKHVAARMAENDDLMFVATPKVRSQGSLDVIKEALDLHDEPTNVRRALRPLGVFDPEEFRKIHEEHRKGRSMHYWERKWSSNPFFDEIEHIAEPRSKIAERAHRALAAAVRQFRIYHRDPERQEQTPHVVGVAHFEVLNQLLVEAFQMDPAKDRLIRYGETVDIDVLSPDDPSDKDAAILRITFRRKTATVKFNVRTYAIEQL